MDYNCINCNKFYKSYQSLWNHNKKFHKTRYGKSVALDEPGMVRKDEVWTHQDHVIHCDTFVIPNVINDNTLNIQEKKILECKHCNRRFNFRSNKWKHEKVCKKNNEEINKLQEENKKRELELELKKEEAKILELRLKLQKSEKIDNITLRKLNKLLIEHNNRIKNYNISNLNNNNNTQNIQNNFVNNYQIVGFGREENITDLLTNQEKRMILNSKLLSLEKLIEIVHCGKYNQFKNIIITNIKDNYMYKYDENKGIFVLSNKADVLNSLIDFRLGDLEIIYNEFLEKNKIDERTKNCIEKFINKINYDNEKYINTIDGREHDNYKQYKISEIKVLLFNNQDKITNDISLLLSTEETPSIFDTKLQITDETIMFS